ncbi:MAG: radical SAM protein [Desulfovibrio sp.]|jgi:hypothetical protein|nr:radical SAM protein [Desulfovibrio sp.]
MINFFVSFSCNLRCPYCFALELRKRHPAPMDDATFERLRDWVAAYRIPLVSLIGGEPTTHPRILEMATSLAETGSKVALFTNALASESLLERLVEHVDNFVVNYNAPSLLTPSQQEQRCRSLALLSEKARRLTFSKNFFPGGMTYDYFLEGLARYKVSAVRCDVARPSFTGANSHSVPRSLPAVMTKVVAFAEKCKNMGVPTGLDCCVRLCALNEKDTLFMEKQAVKFTGICHPSMDIFPDLSASYCLPLYDLHVDDVTSFAGEEALQWHMAEAARPLRRQAANRKCLGCDLFQRRCQGGCLAQKRRNRLPRGESLS